MLRLTEIDREQALRYLAFGGQKPDRLTTELLNECEVELLERLRPKYTCRVLPFRQTPDGISPQSVRLILPGRDIAAHLHGCEQLILLCATLSADADAYIRRLQVENLAKALVANAMLNAAIEQVCDLAEEEIKASLPYTHYTTRYSPGYGDLPLEVQADFLAAVDAGRRLGVYVNAGGLMTPLKSVTAIIGAASHPLTAKLSGCEGCNQKDTCKYRKAGNHCAF